MAEGSLEAPIRHPLDWHSDDFYDEAKLDEELRRVFDICHGCRRCFNLCDSFPRLFDMIDESDTGELDSVSSDQFPPVEEACTLCDMCFMTKCPYVPPHEFNLDFPHLMLRYRMVRKKNGHSDFTAGQLAEMDRNGKMIRPVAGLANWASRKDNKVTRPVMEKVAGIDATAELPTFAGKTLMMRAKQAEKQGTLAPAADGKATGRKAALFATCNGNYNNPQMGEAALKVLARQGVTAKPVYPGCCGMPFLEQADLERVAEQARKVSKDLRPLVDEGWDIVTLIASCGLMMKFEWPLILPDDENVQALSKAVKDIDEYIVDIAKNEGLADGMKPLSGDVAVHLACHARAQNMGAKAVELLRLIPEAKVTPVERCAGHGGTFGVLKSTHDVAMKVGKTAARNISKAKPEHVVSECPLALKHLMQEIEELGLVEEGKQPPASAHPIELIAQAYGL
ncbi:heterodisulfide reductase-related iron-sulfur binding cluster [Pyruvatibacter mobilis]|jgi:glycerol-3-phosphate dehydrogenase subunit C|uniref:(Fe-S)-binding protein n=1 Tax=Pyruvatibacter mobilis TaxID=1712261 RepID=UPI0004038AE9